MNEYEVKISTGGIYLFHKVMAVSFADAERVAKLEMISTHAIESIRMIHRGIVPHDISSGTSQS